jgi:excisionase family DNA binding protein
MPTQQRAFAHHGEGTDRLTIAQAAAEVPCDYFTIYRAIQRGDLPAIRPTGTRRLIRIERAAFDTWLRGEPVHEVPAVATGP